jgi:hypothetical protein
MLFHQTCQKMVCPHVVILLSGLQIDAKLPSFSPTLSHSNGETILAIESLNRMAALRFRYALASNSVQ